MDFAIRCNNKESHVVEASGGCSAHARYHLLCTSMVKSCGVSTFTEILKEIEKEEQVRARKAVTKEEFQSEWTTPALRSLLLSLRSQTGWKVCRCLPAFSAEHRVPTQHRGQACCSHCSGHWVDGDNHRVVVSCSSAGASAKWKEGWWKTNTSF
jgi:hypothetical protein